MVLRVEVYYFSDMTKRKFPEQPQKARWGNKFGVTHNMSRTAEYKTWKGMRRRCDQRNASEYPHYAGRGITVCDRWSDFPSFFADMGPRPSLKHSLDRIDVNGNYEPGNCRWATAKVQSNNRRTAIRLTWDGLTMGLDDWALRLGVKNRGLWSRYYKGWTTEKILTTPVRSWKRRQSSSAT